MVAKKTEDEKYRTPPRQIGRVSDEDWKYIRRGWKKSGIKTFTEFATQTLKARAKRILKKG